MAPSRAYSATYRQSLRAFKTLTHQRHRPALLLLSVSSPCHLPSTGSPSPIAPTRCSSTVSPGSTTTTTNIPSPSSAPVLEPPDFLSESELHIFKKLKAELDPSKLAVQDISGGCGSMYGLDIVSPKFTGLSVIKQHKLVNKVLEQEIKGWHGVQLKTKAP